MDLMQLIDAIQRPDVEVTMLETIFVGVTISLLSMVVVVIVLLLIALAITIINRPEKQSIPTAQPAVPIPVPIPQPTVPAKTVQPEKPQVEKRIRRWGSPEMIKTYYVTVNGNTYDVEVEEIPQGQVGATTHHAPAVAPRPIVAPTPQPAVAPAPVVASAPVSSSGGTVIEAPMPGSVSDVRVKVGDPVKNGQVLIILEAMKMENEIIATCEGTVSAIHVSKGSSVNAQDALVSIG